MKLKGFDVDLFTIPDREFDAVRIARNRDHHYGKINDHEYQFIIIQLLTEQAKMRELLQAVADNLPSSMRIHEDIQAIEQYINNLPR